MAWVASQKLVCWLLQLAAISCIRETQNLGPCVCSFRLRDRRELTSLRPRVLETDSPSRVSVSLQLVAEDGGRKGGDGERGGGGGVVLQLRRGSTGRSV